MKQFALIFFFALSAQAQLGPGPNDNICPDELIDEVIETGKARINVILSLIPKTTKKNPNCVSKTQGISMLCYMAGTYHNDEYLQVLTELKPDLNFQNITSLYNYKEKKWDPPYKGDFPLLCNTDSNDYIASDTMVFYMLTNGANPDLQEARHGTTAMISAGDEAHHFNTKDPAGKFDSSTEYRKLMYLRLFGANPNLQGWNLKGDIYPDMYAVNIFHLLARNRTGVEILSPFKLLVEPEKYLTYEHFWEQIPKSSTWKNIKMDKATFEALKAKMPKFDPNTLCQKNGNGRTVFDELENTAGVVWNKAPVIRYLKQFGSCRR